MLGVLHGVAYTTKGALRGLVLVATCASPALTHLV